MTDTGTQPTTEPVAPAAPETPADYKALYEAEQTKTADLVRQRNLLKPAERLLQGLDDNSRAALMELGDLVRAGDPNAIMEWNAQVIQQLSGKDLAAYIAAKQTAEQAGVPTEQVAGLTTEQIEALIDQRTDQRLSARDAAAQGQARVAAELDAAGFKIGSAAGETIIRHAVNNELELKDAIDWYVNDTATTLTERQRAAAAAAAAVPGVAPSGTPVGKIPDGRQADETDLEFARRKAELRMKTTPVN